ncbi:MAG: hypothetical protein Q7O66_08095 [Dehalococcoidia bacterium]|nr:hypothetical protein [Dehalococcoidia bacterium]
MSKLMRDQGELAHWKYEARLWRHYVKAEFKENIAGYAALFKILAAVSLLIGIVFAVIDREAGLFVLLLMLALIALMGFLAFVVPGVNNAILKSHPGEAVITNKSVYIGGRLHSWGLPGFALVGATLHNGRHTHVEICYEYPSSPKPQIEEVRVPVPPGREDEARRVVGQLLGQIVAPLG